MRTQYSISKSKSLIEILRPAGGIFLLLLFLAACDTRRTVTMDSENIFSIAADDADFLAAKEEAQASWDRFVSYNNPDNCKFCNCLAKRAYTDGTQVEHMWIAPFRIDGDTIWGTLLDVPELVHNIKEGDTTFVTRSNIDDWGVVGMNGIMLGNFLEERIKVKARK